MNFSVGSKLNILLVILMLTGIGGASFTATQLFSVDLLGYFKKGTLDTASLLARSVEAEIEKDINRAQILGAAGLFEFRFPEDRVKFIENNFATQLRYISLAYFNLDPVETKWRILNPEIKKRYSITPGDLSSFDSTEPVSLKSIGQGNVQIQSFATAKGLRILRISFPLVKDPKGKVSSFLVLDLDRDAVAAIFSETTNFLSYLVDGTGKVVASTNPAMIPVDSNLNSLSIVKENISSASQKEYLDQRGVNQVGAVAPVGIGGLKVITQIPREQAQTARNKLLKRMLFVSGAFIFFALMLGVLFTDNLLRRIQALAAAAEKVRLGDFSVRLTTLIKGKVKEQDMSHGDEIQKFAGIFNQMVHGIQEREKMKGLLEKFHHKDIVSELLKKSRLELGGERMEATVLFIDIRGFAQMSENLPPEKTVALLNKYIGMVVEIVMKRNGVVDKYIGDAIMVMWGVPKSLGNDVWNALMTCLEIRQALAVLNKTLKDEGLPELKIGMGLHCGPVVAGTVGSHQKMQYTVVGDTVNTASRLEGATKIYGVDILLSELVFKSIEHKFLLTSVDSVKLRGKSQQMMIYKVDGYINEAGNPEIVQTPYSTFEPDPDFNRSAFVA